jgi:hypothetical protein
MSSYVTEKSTASALTGFNMPQRQGWPDQTETCIAGLVYVAAQFATPNVGQDSFENLNRLVSVQVAR